MEFFDSNQSQNVYLFIEIFVICFFFREAVTSNRIDIEHWKKKVFRWSKMKAMPIRTMFLIIYTFDADECEHKKSGKKK